MHALEIELLSKVDVRVLCEPTIHDCVREMSELEFHNADQKKKLLSYVDNYMCYVLVNMGLEAHIALHCAAAMMFFFAANRSGGMVESLASIVRAQFIKKSSFFDIFNKVVAELAHNLKILGNDPRVVESVARDFEARSLFS